MFIGIQLWTVTGVIGRTGRAVVSRAYRDKEQDQDSVTIQPLCMVERLVKEPQPRQESVLWRNVSLVSVKRFF